MTPSQLYVLAEFIKNEGECEERCISCPLLDKDRILRQSDSPYSCVLSNTIHRQHCVRKSRKEQKEAEVELAKDLLVQHGRVDLLVGMCL